MSEKPEIEIIEWGPSDSEEQFEAVEAALSLGAKGFKFVFWVDGGGDMEVAVLSKVKLSENQAQKAYYDFMRGED